MTPGARYQAAIDLLGAILRGEPAERELTRWARASRFAGSKDRAQVRDLVFDALRRRRSLAARAGAETARGLILALADEAEDLDEGFRDGSYAPDAPSPDELAALRRAAGTPPHPVAYDYPDFLEAEIARSLGAGRDRVLGALRQRAPVDLRVNPLRGTVAGAKVMLAQEGIGVEEHPLSPHALRVVENPRAVGTSRAYTSGLIELQDVSSQAVALFTAAEPGMRVLDYCAGGGGKTLALAAMLRGRGLLVAHDVNPARMKDLPDRARRAGAEVHFAATADLWAGGTKFDLVLADAPCTGSGAWRRNPDAKWRLVPETLARLTATQAEVLDRAASLVVPGGKLVYATCSFLAAENRDQTAAFLARRGDAVSGQEADWLPPEDGDGFFAAAFRIGGAR
jgi:16S rRNA (cytosine967-C5)-methyltransferase